MTMLWQVASRDATAEYQTATDVDQAILVEYLLLLLLVASLWSRLRSRRVLVAVRRGRSCGRPDARRSKQVSDRGRRSAMAMVSRASCDPGSRGSMASSWP